MTERKRVLIADDNAAMREMIAGYLARQEDVEVVGEAADGAEAIGLAEQLAPDILLLDIIMPGRDGFSVLEALTGREGAPKVIVLTGLCRDDFIARAMRLGASYYMVKPVDMEVLHRRIGEVCALARQLAAPEPSAPPSADEQVANLFLALGIPAHIRGYEYLREGVRMVLADHDVINRITKELYPGIARRFGTTASKVERAMRHAIEVAWNRGRLEAVNRLYGYRVFTPEDKPTNGEFIAMIASKAGSGGAEKSA